MANGEQAERQSAAASILRSSRRTRWLLFAMVITYFVVALTLSIARYWDFRTSNYDLGSYEQALWSFSHGRGFFDSGDYGLDGATSLLAVHPALVLYPLAGLYSAVPGPWVLLVLQSAAVAATAIPIFLLTRDATRSNASSLIAAGLYLVWAPTLAGTLTDFHLESFLPLELLTLFLLWSRGRYGWGVLVALVTFATFEAGPPFAALIGLYFLLPSGVALRDWWTRSKSRSITVPASADRPALAASKLWPFSSRTAWSLGLVVGSLAASILLLLFQESFSTMPGAGGVSALDALASNGFPQATIALSAASTNFVLKIGYWVLVYALVAFLPARAPRSFILAGPWIVTTLFADPKFTTFGLQYGFLAAMPVFVGVAYGLVGIQWHHSVSGKPEVAEPVPAAGRHRQRRPWKRWTPWATAVMLAVVANILLSPINPATQQPGTGTGYNVSLSFEPGAQALEQLLGVLPPGAQIVASDDLFPFVANDLNAYGLLEVPYPPPFLPFNQSHPPDWVLVSQGELDDVPTWLYNLLQPPSPYGLRGTVGETPVGIVDLFEAGYRGPSENLGSAGFASTTYWPPQIEAGVAGEFASDPPVHFPYVIESLPGSTGNIWFGPYVGLPAGQYLVSTVLRPMLPLNGTPASTGAAILLIDTLGFAIPRETQAVLSTETLTPGVWTTVSFSLTFEDPTPQVQVRGFQMAPGYSIELGPLTISPLN